MKRYARKRYIIVARSKGLEDRYYVTSATQGPKLIPWAYSMAVIFDSLKEARKQVTWLKQHFKGVQQWRCVRYHTPEQSQWEM